MEMRFVGGVMAKADEPELTERERADLAEILAADVPETPLEAAKMSEAKDALAKASATVNVQADEQEYVCPYDPGDRVSLADGRTATFLGENSWSLFHDVMPDGTTDVMQVHEGQLSGGSGARIASPTVAGRWIDYNGKKVFSAEKGGLVFNDPAGILKAEGWGPETFPEMVKGYMGFSALSAKLQSKGHSKASADRIAASVGRAKYGAKGMAAKASAGKKH